MARRSDAVMMNLIAATSDIQLHLDNFARTHRKVIAFGAVVTGMVRGVFVMASDDVYSPVGLDRMRTWARIIGNLPEPLLEVFEAELAAVKAGQRAEERER